MLKEYFKDKESKLPHKCQLTHKDHSVDHSVKMEARNMIIKYWGLRHELND